MSVWDRTADEFMPVRAMTDVPKEAVRTRGYCTADHTPRVVAVVTNTSLITSTTDVDLQTAGSEVLAPCPRCWREWWLNPTEVRRLVQRGWNFIDVATVGRANTRLASAP